MEVSPKYQMQLIQNIEATLWDLYETSKYKNVLHYIKKWQKITGYGFHNDEECNFYIKFKEDGNIDLSETLHSINDGDLILKIAVDLGVETPGFIPVVPELRYCQFISTVIQKQIKEKTYGTALLQINIGDLRMINIVLPSLPEQFRIVAHLDAVRAETEQLESLYTAKLASLDELRRSVLQEAFV